MTSTNDGHDSFSRLSATDAEELYTMRVVLEATAMRLSVPRLETTEVTALEDLLSEMNRQADEKNYERWMLLHRAYHQLLRSGSGRLLTEELSRLSDQAEVYRRIYTLEVPGSWSTGMNDHRKLLEHCKQRDPVGGASTMAVHLSRTALGVIALAAPEHAPVSLTSALSLATGGHPPDSGI